VTCDQLHCIPYRWIAPGVSQAFLTKPLKNGSAAQVLWGVYGSCDNLFFSGKKRWGALANTKSPATRFIGNGIDALLLLFFERCSAVSQTKFSEFYFRNFKKILNRGKLLKHKSILLQCTKKVPEYRYPLYRSTGTRFKQIILKGFLRLDLQPVQLIYPAARAARARAARAKQSFSPPTAIYPPIYSHMPSHAARASGGSKEPTTSSSSS
jgi:hypothetical protein